ncbi:hypothetical protein QBC37DRAFT_387215 [Rhypophila decipiens]|uniref:Uncharacterized protein n=1 Tax=Rhypophila decipiens TaxID=261697 RepID=A0AAN7B8I7_9PEZI|nr:hypothetical protein QBC37DRAFT_387215 [Rhypophila decipiens]
MRSRTLLLLTGSLAITGTTAMQINCNSFGLEDGYQGVDWRASTKDCADATNALEEGYPEWDIPLASNDCQNLMDRGECRISICDANDVTEGVSWLTVWAAARIIHARHKHGGKVAGYVSLDDYVTGFKAFVKVAKIGTPNPTNKRKRDGLPALSEKSLFGRRSALDASAAEAIKAELAKKSPTNGNETDQALVRRDHDDQRYVDWTEIEIPETDLHTNIHIGWNDAEYAPAWNMRDAGELLLTAHQEAERAGSDTSSLRPGAFHAPADVLVEFEWAAHNNHNARDINNGDLRQVVFWAIRERADRGGHGSFIAQIRRGAESVGHLLVRVFRVAAPANQQVCA